MHVVPPSYSRAMLTAPRLRQISTSHDLERRTEARASDLISSVLRKAKVRASNTAPAFLNLWSRVGQWPLPHCATSFLNKLNTTTLTLDRAKRKVCEALEPAVGSQRNTGW